MNKELKKYFAFSKKDRIAVVVLTLFITTFLLLPYFFKVKKNKIPVDPLLVEQVNALKQKKLVEQNNGYKRNENWQDNANEPSTINRQPGQLFQFNPNTLDEAGWVRLGIREKTAKTIINYRNKGGKFKSAEDIRKIWGLRKEEADRIIPYAVVTSNINNTSKNSFNNATTSNSKPLLLDANTCTPYELKNIPRIGTSLPYKIVNFREKLGGFLNMAQVKETYGMNDSIFTTILPYLHVLPTQIKTININTASEFELNAHPYIDQAVAKAIVLYRTKYGGYGSVIGIKKIVFITDEMYNKIAPYLSVDTNE